MALRPLNSIAGFSAGDPAITVIQANGDVTTVNLTANGLSNLGQVANLTILGGNVGEYLKTDGAGNLEWDSIGNLSSNRAAPMPYLIPNGESYIVNENFQGLYSQAITIDGELTVDGILIEVPISFAAEPNQILFAENGSPAGSEGFTFDQLSGNVAIPGNLAMTGDILPTANVTYNLGSNTHRWNDIWLSNSTIYIGDSSITTDANTLVLTSGTGASFEVSGNANVSILQNGNSNISIDLNSNITFGVAGVPNVLIVTSSGIDYQGNISTSGNLITSGNIIIGNVLNKTLDNTKLSLNGNMTTDGFIQIGIPSGNIPDLSPSTRLSIEGDMLQSNGNITTSGKLIANTIQANGNVVIDGSLFVNGNTTYINVETIQVEDPLIIIGSGPNGAPLNTNDGKDRGTILDYYAGAPVSAFMGWDNSNAEFAFGSNVSVASDVVTINTLGNVRAGQFLGTGLNVSGNAVIGGNLFVNGNITYINVDTIQVEDPILVLGSGPNGSPLIANDGKDRGTLLDYYTTEPVSAFMGWDNSNGEFAFGSNVTVANEVVTFNTLGNARASHFIGELVGNVTATTISGNLTTATQSNITTVGTLGNLAVTGNITSGNVNAGNLLVANYLISNSGCVSVNGAFLAYNNSTGAGGIFTSGPTDINLGLAANINIGSTTGNTTIRGNLVANNNITVNGNISANLITGTLTTASQSNITTVGTLGNLSVANTTTTNDFVGNTLTVNEIISRRSNINVTTGTVIDSFAANEYRTAKYTVRSSNDLGYESLEVLLIHNNINSYITVYGAINTGGGNTVNITTALDSGTVELRATGLSSNTVINLIATYVPD